MNLEEFEIRPWMEQYVIDHGIELDKKIFSKFVWEMLQKNKNQQYIIDRLQDIIDKETFTFVDALFNTIQSISNQKSQVNEQKVSKSIEKKLVKPEIPQIPQQKSRNESPYPQKSSEIEESFKSSEKQEKNKKEKRNRNEKSLKKRDISDYSDYYDEEEVEKEKKQSKHKSRKNEPHTKHKSHSSDKKSKGKHHSREISSSYSETISEYEYDPYESEYSEYSYEEMKPKEKSSNSSKSKEKSSNSGKEKNSSKEKNKSKGKKSSRYYSDDYDYSYSDYEKNESDSEDYDRKHKSSKSKKSRSSDTDKKSKKSSNKNEKSNKSNEKKEKDSKRSKHNKYKALSKSLQRKTSYSESESSDFPNFELTLPKNDKKFPVSSLAPSDQNSSFSKQDPQEIRFIISVCGLTDENNTIPNMYSYFSKYGPIKCIQVLRKLNCALIEFYMAEQAYCAVNDKSNALGEYVSIDYASNFDVSHVNTALTKKTDENLIIVLSDSDDDNEYE